MAAMRYQKERAALKNFNPSIKWADRVDELTGRQVLSIIANLKLQNKDLDL